MDQKELVELFERYLYRKPNSKEIRYHIQKSYNDFEKELANCDERKAILNPKKPVHIPGASRTIAQKRAKVLDKNIALLLSGHVRKFSIANETLKRILDTYNIDVFVHTWDDNGKKGKEINLNSPIEREKVNEIINTLPNLVQYKIENNKKFITSLPKPDCKYFNFSSPEVFIKSQLYSINQSYKLMEEYCNNRPDKKYDLVIKARMDCYFSSFDLSIDVVNDVNNHKIIFVPNQDCGHVHPDYGTSCQTCDTMYYTHGFKRAHIFDHSSIVCDIFAYGSMQSMKEYCSLYDQYDILNKKFEEENLQSLNEKDVAFTLNNNVYSLSEHLKSIYYFNCSYPEKLLINHLKKYMLIKSENIKMKFTR